MQFQEHLPQDGWNIEGCSDGRLKINGETHTEAVCLIEGCCLPANAARPQDLTADSFSDGLIELISASAARLSKLFKTA